MPSHQFEDSNKRGFKSKSFKRRRSGFGRRSFRRGGSKFGGKGGRLNQTENKIQVIKSQRNIRQGRDNYGGQFANLRNNTYGVRFEDYTYNIEKSIRCGNGSHDTACLLATIPIDKKGSLSNFTLDYSLNVQEIRDNAASIFQEDLNELELAIDIYTLFRNAVLDIIDSNPDDPRRAYLGQNISALLNGESSDIKTILINNPGYFVDFRIVTLNTLVTLDESGLIDNRIDELIMARDETQAAIDTFELNSRSFTFPYRIICVFADMTKNPAQVEDNVRRNIVMSNEHLSYTPSEDIIFIKNGIIVPTDTVISTRTNEDGDDEEFNLVIYNTDNVTLQSGHVFNNTEQSAIYAFLISPIRDYVMKFMGTLNYQTCSV